MENRMQKRWTLVAVIGLAHWFFGNLYEAIVLAPNMIGNSLVQLKRWQEYFTVTNQIYYYVPFTQTAVLIIIILFFTNRLSSIKYDLRMASIFGVLSLLLTIYIVTQLNLSLFFGDLEKVSNRLTFMAWQWNVMNVVRIVLVGTTLTFAFKAYEKM
jgi:hypothetical protein